MFVNSLSSSREFDEEQRRLQSSINPKEFSKKREVLLLLVILLDHTCL